MARQDPVLKRIPGVVSNVLPLRLSVRPDMSFSRLIGKVDQEVSDVLTHQRYRGEDLHRDLGLPNNAGTSFVPVINIMSFDYDLRFAGYRSATHNISVESCSVGPISDLSIFLWDRRDGAGLEIDWHTHLEVCSADDLAAHQQRFLRWLETFTTRWRSATAATSRSGIPTARVIARRASSRCTSRTRSHTSWSAVRNS